MKENVFFIIPNYDNSVSSVWNKQMTKVSYLARVHMYRVTLFISVSSSHMPVVTWSLANHILIGSKHLVKYWECGLLRIECVPIIMPMDTLHVFVKVLLPVRIIIEHGSVVIDLEIEAPRQIFA